MTKRRNLKETISPALAFEAEDTAEELEAKAQEEEAARQAEEAAKLRYEQRKAELKGKVNFKVTFDAKQGGNGTHLLSGELEGKLTIAKVPGGVKAPELIKAKTAELTDRLIQTVLAKEFKNYATPKS